MISGADDSTSFLTSLLFFTVPGSPKAEGKKERVIILLPVSVMLVLLAFCVGVFLLFIVT
jgi:hypothetical protein